MLKVSRPHALRATRYRDSMMMRVTSILRRVWGLALGLALMLTACTEEANLPGEPFRLSTQSLPAAVQGEAYREAVVATGGLRPVRFELSAGGLPPGLDLQNGLLVGAPETVGTFAFTVTASDANLASTFREYRLTVTEVPIPTLTVALPTTEIRDAVTVPVRLENARDVRGVRLRLAWPEGNASVEEASVQADRSDAVLFAETQPGQLAADVAALGDPWSGDRTLLSFDVATAAATTVQMDVTAEILYGDRTEVITRSVGTAPEDEDDVAAEDDDAETPAREEETP